MSSLVLAMDIVSSLLHIWQRDEFLEYDQYHYLEYGKMELYIKHFLHVKLIWIKKKSLLYGRTRSKETFRNANSCFTVNT